jgi:hypothetical protein
MSTPEPRLLRVVVAGDLPVLWSLFRRLDLPATVDGHCPVPPHWKGPLSPGEVLAAWLLFIVSEGDHCLNHVESWVDEHRDTLAALVGKPVRPTALHDDRLADWLTRLGAGDSFCVLERDLNQQTVRVYQLPTDLVRIDTTTANSYADVLSDRGLLQFGHSKDDPDRPQFKVAAAVLDPLGMPLATAVVPGNSTDDPLYVPAIAAVRRSLGAGGRTYVGDCKMAALGILGLRGVAASNAAIPGLGSSPDGPWWRGGRRAVTAPDPKAVVDLFTSDRVRRLEFERGAARLNRLIQVPLTTVHVGEVHPRLGHPGAEHDRSLEGNRGPCQLPRISERDTQVVVGDGGARIESDSFPVGGDRAFKVSLVAEGGPKVHVTHRERRVEADGLPATGDRLVNPPRHAERGPQVRMGRGQGRVRPNRLAEGGQGPRDIPLGPQA